MEDLSPLLEIFRLLMVDRQRPLFQMQDIKTKAETEFEKYRVIQDRLFMSDFDKYMLELEENAKK